MKKMLFIFSFLCLAMSANAIGNSKTTSLNGKVVDENGEAVIGAKVFLENSDNAVYTDFDGNFTLKEVPKDFAKITISMVSFEDNVQHLEVRPSKQNNLNIQLETK